MNLQPVTRTPQYRGRLAPSPTGHLHLGHARTFWTASQRARKHSGTLVLRSEDIDGPRCKPEFLETMFDDLRWFGFDWQEGPDCGGPYGPYNQRERYTVYQEALERLRFDGFIYPCTCSRRDIQSAASAPQGADDEVVYPGTCRGSDSPVPAEGSPTRLSWRFRVPDEEEITFHDVNLGPQRMIAGTDFGDFVVWRNDGVPAYQLAVVVDDAAMHITEVVRGEDLLVSTARQLLLYRALGLDAPRFYHCSLMKDENGIRLAKRCDSLSLRTLRVRGESPEGLRSNW